MDFDYKELKKSNDFDYEELKNLNIWANKYEEILTTFRDDLELKLNRFQDIYIAVDFYDIVNHVFPLRSFQRTSNGRIWLRQEISRIGLFKTLGSIYKLPLILLPPYILECNDFFALTKVELFKLQEKENLDKLYEQIKDIDLKNKDNINDNLGFVALLYSPYFMKGLDGLMYLLRNNIRLVPKGIKGYLDDIKKIRNLDNVKYFEIINELRPGKSKIISNVRDAKAIQYIDEINKIWNGKAIMLLFSTSPVFILFNIENELSKKINGTDYPLLRTSEFFYYASIYTYACLGLFKLDSKTNLEKFNLDESQLYRLLSHITYHLNTIKFVQSLTDTYIDHVEKGLLCGIYREEYLGDAISRSLQFKDVTEKIERELNISYLRELCGDENLNCFKHFVNEEIATSLDNIRKEINESLLSEKILKNINQLEQEQTNFEKWIGICEEVPNNSRIWLIYCFKDYDMEKILNKNFNELNNLLNKKDLKTLDDPDLIIVSNGEWLIYDKAKTNHILYYAKRGSENNYYIYMINIRILFTDLKNNFSRYNKQELDIDWLKSSPLINLLKKLLHNGEIANIENYTEILNLLHEIEQI